jgi:hypothetical protein
MVLAVPESASLYFKRRIAQRLFETQSLRVMVIQIEEEVILEWLPQALT